MQKVIVYYGEDSFGRSYELAILDGLYYTRTKFRSDRYGMIWGQWEQVNEFNGTFYDDNSGDKRLKWGWGFDARCLGVCRRKIQLKVK